MAGVNDYDYENSFDSGDMSRVLGLQFNNRDPSVPRWYDKDPEPAYWVLPDGTRMTDSQYNAWLATQATAAAQDAEYEESERDKPARTRETRSGRVYISPTTGEVRTQKEADEDLGFFGRVGRSTELYKFNPETGEYEFDPTSPGTTPRMLNILGDLGMLYLLSQGRRPGERDPGDMRDDADPAFQQNTNWSPTQQQNYDYWSNIAPTPRREISQVTPTTAITPSVGYAAGGHYSSGGRKAGVLQRMAPNHVVGSTGGQADAVEARLSDGEYVIDADVVSALGDGNNAHGAKKLDEMREAIRRHKRSAPPSKIPPKAKSPLEYVGAMRKKGA